MKQLMLLITTPKEDQCKKKENKSEIKEENTLIGISNKILIASCS